MPMKTLRLVLSLAVMVPAWALLGGFTRLDSPGPGGGVGGMVVGGAIGVFFGLVFGGNPRWGVWDYLFGPAEPEELDEGMDRTAAGLYHAEEGDAINLLTYFRAKGRQWNTVIIPGANQKVIPLGNCNLEDERRLFYVAVTRATSNLIVSFVRNAVRSKVEPSQFVAEMGLKDAEEQRATVLSL